MRCQIPDTLINQVDDDALLPGGQPFGEILRQHKRCAQIGFHMIVPALTRGGADIIIFKGGCIIDQHTNRAKCSRCFAYDTAAVFFLAKISGNNAGATTKGPDFLGKLFRIPARGMAMKGNIITLCRQIKR